MNFQNPDLELLQTILAGLGGLWVLFKILSILGSFYRVCLRPRRKLLKRYGEGSYALVTGASDGIGKEFCR